MLITLRRFRSSSVSKHLILMCEFLSGFAPYCTFVSPSPPTPPIDLIRKPPFNFPHPPLRTRNKCREKSLTLRHLLPSETITLTMFYASWFVPLWQLVFCGMTPGGFSKMLFEHKLHCNARWYFITAGQPASVISWRQVPPLGARQKSKSRRKCRTGSQFCTFSHPIFYFFFLSSQKKTISEAEYYFSH